MKETAVSFNSNGDNPLNKLKVVNICGRYEHSCVIKELIFFGDGFPYLSYIIVPPHEKGQLEAFMPVYSDYQVQQEVRADEAMNQNRASKYIKCEIAAILKRLKSVFVLCCTQGKRCTLCKQPSSTSDKLRQFGRTWFKGRLRASLAN